MGVTELPVQVEAYIQDGAKVLVREAEGCGSAFARLDLDDKAHLARNLAWKGVRLRSKQRVGNLRDHVAYLAVWQADRQDDRTSLPVASHAAPAVLEANEASVGGIGILRDANVLSDSIDVDFVCELSPKAARRLILRQRERRVKLSGLREC